MERMSSDTLGSLITIYKQFYHLESGKVVRDISLVWRELIDWKTIEEAENIIPFKFGESKYNKWKIGKMPIGYRIWMLSRNQGERYYAGNFFDCIVSGQKRIHRLKCKLSSEAIKFFEEGHYDN